MMSIRTEIRLLYIDPCTMGAWDDRLQGILDRHREPSTRIDVTHLSPAEGEQPEIMLPAQPFYYRELFEAVHQAEVQGYDAVIIGCASDPGWKAASYMANIPVLAPFHAALHVGKLLGHRIGVLCQAQGGRKRRPLSWAEDNVVSYGFRRDIVSFRLVEVAHPAQQTIRALEAEQNWEAVREQVLTPFRTSIEGDALKQAEFAVKQDGADVLFFACTFWSDLLGPIAEALDVVVLDPVVTVLRAAELSVRIGRRS